MERSEINKYIEKSVSSWLLTRIHDQRNTKLFQSIQVTDQRHGEKY